MENNNFAVGMRTPELGSALFDSATSSAEIETRPIFMTDAGRISSEQKRSRAKKNHRKKSSERMDALESKLDRLMNMISDNNKKGKDGGVFSPEVRTNTINRGPGRNKQDRLMSMCSQSEDEDLVPLLTGKGDTLSLSEDEMPILEPHDGVVEPVENAELDHGLFSLFGDDARAKKSTATTVGLKLDKAQREVLDCSWRAVNPTSISSFMEENLDLFPIEEKDNDFLKVPTLDSMVESFLVQKHGPKAAFSGKKTLYQQPYKTVEKIAFKGQQSALMGIKILLYIQQACAKMKEGILDPKENNKDVILDQIQNLFAMSTKALDQMGRAGAFHHLIRRSVSLTDSSLFEIDESKSLFNLPLSGEGVFGPELEKNLKEKKEQRKAVQDLLPDRLRKRKTPFTTATPAKRPYYGQKDNFRGSRDRDFNRFPNSSGYTRRYDGPRTRKPSFTATSSNSGSSKKQ